MYEGLISVMCALVPGGGGYFHIVTVFTKQANSVTVFTKRSQCALCDRFVKTVTLFARFVKTVTICMHIEYVPRERPPFSALNFRSRAYHFHKSSLTIRTGVFGDFGPNFKN